MQYKTIVLNLLQQHPEIESRLRQERRLLQSLELWSSEFKANHEAWKERLFQAKPESDRSQIASEALELALEELTSRLRSETSDPEENETFSLDAAMELLRRHTPTR